MDDRQECIRSCIQHGLLATQRICPTCNRYCTEQALDRVVDGVTWHCPLKVCKNRTGIRHGSFFEKSHLQLWQILGLTYLWCRSAGKSRRLSIADARMNCKLGVSIPQLTGTNIVRTAVSYFTNNQCGSGLKQNLNQCSAQQSVTWFQITWQSSCGTRDPRNILTSTFGLKLHSSTLYELHGKKRLF